MAEAIRRAIDALPDRCRQIFLLSREKYLSYAEIAEVLGISVKTVETQMWRALKSLRKSLAPYLGLVLTLAALARLGSHLVG
jgi:RNA polymerase sigma-70 factor (ECF subfamily)